MKQFIRKSLSVLSICLLVPQIIYAQGLSFSLVSPLDAENFPDLIGDILTVAILIATPIVVLYIIYAGFMYVTARGNAEQTQKATKALTYALIGGVLILGAVSLQVIIADVVNSFRT